jgi:hypothetical protein
MEKAKEASSEVSKKSEEKKLEAAASVEKSNEVT